MPCSLSKIQLQRVLGSIDTDSDPGGCWLWTGTVDASGYGTFTAGAADRRQAHRFTYELWVEPIPDGLVIDHLCRVRNCVNPEHLEPVTHRENILRGVGPTAENARRTHCKNGHEYTDGNTIKRHGSRVCQTCAGLSESRRRTDLDERIPEIVERRLSGESFRSIGADMGADHHIIAKRFRQHSSPD